MVVANYFILFSPLLYGTVHYGGAFLGFGICSMFFLVIPLFMLGETAYLRLYRASSKGSTGERIFCLCMGLLTTIFIMIFYWFISATASIGAAGPLFWWSLFICLPCCAFLCMRKYLRFVSGLKPKRHFFSRMEKGIMIVLPFIELLILLIFLSL